MLDQYRQRRLQELQQATLKNRFGDYCEIVKDDWVREVTEGSNSSIVVVHLYESSMIECQLVDEALIKLSAKFKYIKFLKIKSTQAIENWPDRNLPTLFVYEEGALKTQMLTLNSVGGLSMKPDGNFVLAVHFIFSVFIKLFSDLEWFFVEKGIVTDSELEEDPREELARANKTKKGGKYGISRRTGLDSDDEDYTDN
jgi:hypothetical protein